MDEPEKLPCKASSIYTSIAVTGLLESPSATMCRGELENVASCGWHTVMAGMTTFFWQTARGVAFNSTSTVPPLIAAKSIFPSRLKSPATSPVFSRSVVKMNLVGVGLQEPSPLHNQTYIPSANVLSLSRPTMSLMPSPLTSAAIKAPGDSYELLEGINVFGTRLPAAFPRYSSTPPLWPPGASNQDTNISVKPSWFISPVFISLVCTY